MKTRAQNVFFALALLAFSTLDSQLSSAHAQGTAFTYNGRLNVSGNPANGIYDLRFAVCDAVTNGNYIGVVTNSATGITNGLFTATLDFGGVFNGSNYWLEVAVQTNGGSGFATLSPRQPVMPTPYAIYSASAGSALTATTATTATSANSVSAANISGTVQLAQLPGTILTNGGSGVNLTGTFSGNGGGLTNLNGANLTAGSVGNMQLAGGALAAPISVAGGSLNAAANTSYVITNAGVTAVYLPTNANIGDVVQIAGEGAGGWTAGVGGNNNTNWTLTGAPNEGWNSVASSSDGSHLVAVVIGGGIYTSANSAVTWTLTGAPNEVWGSVASSSDGSHLVAGVIGGGIYTSADSGATWTQTGAPSGSGYAWYSVASSSDGSHLVAAEGLGIFTSTNSGATWTQTGVPGYCRFVASSSDGSHLVAVVSGGGIYTSADSGATWTQTGAPSENWESVASSSDGSHLVAAAYDGGIYTSTNSGATWTQTGAPNEQWYFVASSSDGSHLVAVVNGGGGIYTSADSGATWTQTGAPSEDWRSVASSSDGSNLVAVVNGGGIYTDFSFAVVSSGAQGSSGLMQYVGNGVWQSVTLNAGQLPGVVVTNTESGVTLSGTFTGNLSGNAATATAATTAGIATNVVSGIAITNAFITNSVFAGNGGGLTNLNYNNIANPPAIPSTNGFVTASVTNGLATTNFVTSLGYLTSANGGNATLATNVVSGISITNAFITNSVFAGNGAGLTNLNAGNLTGAIQQAQFGTNGSYAVTIGDGTHNFTTSVANGYYTRVGGLAFVEIYVAWNSTNSTTASSSLNISLPFPVGTSSRAMFTLGYVTGITFGNQLTPIASQGNSSLQLVDLLPSGQVNAINVSNCAASGQIQLSGFFRP